MNERCGTCKGTGKVKALIWALDQFGEQCTDEVSMPCFSCRCEMQIDPPAEPDPEVNSPGGAC